MLVAIGASQFKCPVHSRSWKTYLKTDVLEERTDDVLNRTRFRKTQKVPFKAERRCQAQPHGLQGLTCSSPSTLPLGPGPPQPPVPYGHLARTACPLRRAGGANVFGKL